MAWQSECVRIIRFLIDDLSEPLSYTDDRLEELVLVSAQMVQFDLKLVQTYTIDVDQLMLSPDPTDRSLRDEAFINLICIKAACILDRGKAGKKSDQSISIRDGSSSIDLRGPASARIALLDKGWCKVYDDVKYEYQMGNVSGAGSIILSPYRHYSNTGYNRLEFR